MKFLCVLTGIQPVQCIWFVRHAMQILLFLPSTCISVYCLHCIAMPYTARTVRYDFRFCVRIVQLGLHRGHNPDWSRKQSGRCHVQQLATHACPERHYGTALEVGGMDDVWTFYQFRVVFNMFRRLINLVIFKMFKRSWVVLKALS